MVTGVGDGGGVKTCGGSRTSRQVKPKVLVAEEKELVRGRTKFRLRLIKSLEGPLLSRVI